MHLRQVGGEMNDTEVTSEKVMTVRLFFFHKYNLFSLQKETFEP